MQNGRDLTRQLLHPAQSDSVREGEERVAPDRQGSGGESKRGLLDSDWLVPPYASYGDWSISSQGRPIGFSSPFRSESPSIYVAGKMGFHCRKGPCALMGGASKHIPPASVLTARWEVGRGFWWASVWVPPPRWASSRSRFWAVVLREAPPSALRAREGGEKRGWPDQPCRARGARGWARRLWPPQGKRPLEHRLPVSEGHRWAASMWSSGPAEEQGARLSSPWSSGPRSLCMGGRAPFLAEGRV